MPVAFGIGVGDLIAAVGVLRGVIKALTESKGSSKEYLQLIAELWGLENALVQVKARYEEIDRPEQRLALQQAVEACESTIDNFLASVRKYHGHLSIIGTDSKWKDGVRKVQWHLIKAEELGAFKKGLAAHVQSMQTLLITIQVTALSINQKTVNRNGEQLTSQGNTLLAIGRLNEVNQFLVRFIETANNAVLLKAVERLESAVPPQVLLQRPVMFLDARDRLAPIHLEWIDCWAAFHAVLKVRFRDAGLRKIENGDFALCASRTGRDLDTTRPLKSCMFPGCKLDCDGLSDRDVQCPNCNTSFRRILDIRNDEFEIYKGQVRQRHPQEYRPQKSLPRKRKRAESPDDEDGIENFTRVRVIVDLFTSGPESSHKDGIGSLDFVANARALPKSVVAKLVDLKPLKCRDCMGVLWNPLILVPCGHSLCFQCWGTAFDLLVKHPANHPLKCIRCQTIVDVFKITDLRSLQGFHYLERQTPTNRKEDSFMIDECNNLDPIVAMNQEPDPPEDYPSGTIWLNAGDQRPLHDEGGYGPEGGVYHRLTSEVRMEGPEI